MRISALTKGAQARGLPLLKTPTNCEVALNLVLQKKILLLRSAHT